MIETEATARVAFVHFVDAPTADDVEVSVRFVEGVAAGHTVPIAYVCVISGRTRLPDEAGRAAFLANADRVMACVGSLHLVFAASPFVNAVGTSLATAARIVKRYGERVVRHGSLESALLAVRSMTDDQGALERAASAIARSMTEPGATHAPARER